MCCVIVFVRACCCVCVYVPTVGVIVGLFESCCDNVCVYN